MGIYHKQVTDGAHYSGNSSVLMLDPRYRKDLQLLWSDQLDAQMPDIEDGGMTGRSRASSMDSTLSGYSVCSEQPMQLFNLRVELNNSMKNYALGNEVELGT